MRWGHISFGIIDPEFRLEVDPGAGGEEGEEGDEGDEAMSD